MKNKIMLIDGNSILNRAFYAIPLLTTKQGNYTNAIYGFLNILFKLIEEEKPSYLCVCFDLPKPTFRHLKYSAYKGNRRKSPDELREQIPALKHALKLMNINVVEKEGFEADDILASIAKHAEEKGFFSIIVTGDRDLLQVASDNIKIKIPKTKAGKTEVENYLAEDVFKKYGVTPKEFIDVKALMGDSSDNVPGVPSIGEKTALKIIAEYKTLENAIANIKNLKPKKACEMLNEYKDQALLSKYLVTIDLNAPINFEIEDCIINNIFNQDFYDFCQKYELKTFLSKFNTQETKQDFTETALDITLELIEDKIAATSFFERLKQNKDKQIAYKLIFDDDIFYGASFCFKEDFASFIKINDSFNTEDFIAVFKPFFEEDFKKIAHDLKQDIVFFNKFDVCVNNVLFDAMICAYILNSSKNKYEYSDIAFEFLEKEYKSCEQLLGKLKSKKFLFDIDKDAWLKYCCLQSYVVFLATPIMQNLLKENEQEELFYNIEMPLIKVLAQMEIYGIKVCKEELLEYNKNLEIAIDNLTKEIYALAGEQFNINSPKQLGIVLFENLGIKGGKKTASKWSTSADVLEKLVLEHEIIPKILQYRTYAKLKNTYAEGLLNLLDNKTNRIYTKFKQTATATGRLSSTEPNLQNIPIKVELGHIIRKVFKPTDGYIFVDADYSQIELRVLAHLSQDEDLMDAFNKEYDIHKLTASKIFKKPLDEITSFERSTAKAINFGIIYGKQAFSLSQELSISKTQAETYIEEYFEKYPKVLRFLKETVQNASKTGFVKTIFNRKRYISELNSSNFNKKNAAKRIAMNMPIQGSAADIIKLAMIKVFDRLNKEKLKSRLILQIHDELLIEAHKDEVDIVKKILLEEMENVLDFSVKLTIDVNVGENWYEAK